MSQGSGGNAGVEAVPFEVARGTRAGVRLVGWVVMGILKDRPSIERRLSHPMADFLQQTPRPEPCGVSFEKFIVNVVDMKNPSLSIGVSHISTVKNPSLFSSVAHVILYL